MTRDAALARARDLFPDAPIADVLAVADWLLRGEVAPYVAPAQRWHTPPGWWQVTSDTQIVTTNLDARSGEPLLRLVASAFSDGTDADAERLAAELAGTDLGWRPGTGGAPPFFCTRRPDDDGTAGVLARVG